MLANAWKTILMIPLGGLFFISLFYPWNLFIPEAWWPLFPSFLIELPIMYMLNQLVPAIFWLGTFTIGVLMFWWLLKK